MKYFSEQELVMGGLAAVAVGIVLTPLFGIWGWIGLLFGGWLTIRCLAVIDSL